MDVVITSYHCFKRWNAGFRGLYLYEKGAKVQGASWWGKISTAIFDVVAIVLIGIHIPNSIFATISIFVCIVLMLLSLVLYAKQLLSIYKELKNE